MSAPDIRREVLVERVAAERQRAEKVVEALRGILHAETYPQEDEAKRLARAALTEWERDR